MATFKKFGDSFLSRSNKISDLVSSLESYATLVADNEADDKRRKKPGTYDPSIRQCAVCFERFAALLYQA